jgi:predicted PurR-regulated permease PerM
MMSPIIKFFKSVFKGISAIISFIMKTIAWGASKLYKWFTSIFKSNNSTEELKDQYNNTISRINKIANTSVLKDKVSNVVKSMPKLSEYM